MMKNRRIRIFILSFFTFLMVVIYVNFIHIPRSVSESLNIPKIPNESKVLSILEGSSIFKIPTVSKSSSVSKVPNESKIPTLSEGSSLSTISNEPKVLPILEGSTVPKVPNESKVPTLSEGSSLSTIHDVSNAMSLTKFLNITNIPQVSSTIKDDINHFCIRPIIPFDNEEAINAVKNDFNTELPYYQQCQNTTDLPFLDEHPIFDANANKTIFKICLNRHNFKPNDTICSATYFTKKMDLDENSESYLKFGQNYIFLLDNQKMCTNLIKSNYLIVK